MGMTRKVLDMHRRRTPALGGQTVKEVFCTAPQNRKKSNLTLLFVVLVLWLVSGIPTSAQVPSGLNFSYSGDTGPGFWAEINSACGAAPFARQSPVDIRRVVVDPKLGPLDLMLNETSFTLENPQPGYTVRAIPQVADMLILNRVFFNLLNFHFHTLTEHTVDGQHGAMELHAVFQDPNSKNYAVIGVLYKVGKANRFLAKLLTAGLPVKTSSPPVTVESLNLGDAFTDTSSYYTYPGSLTTPPCSENVTWIVLKQPAQMSAAQFKAFHGVLGNDFRPTQDLNGRIIRGTVNRANSPEEQDTQLDRY